jgi:hypothetical protein
MVKYCCNTEIISLVFVPTNAILIEYISIFHDKLLLYPDNYSFYNQMKIIFPSKICITLKNASSLQLLIISYNCNVIKYT